MTKRTPEQAALMAVIESYAEAKSSYQYACLEGCGDDEANAEADLATAFAAMEAIVCAPQVEVVWPAHRGRVNNIDFDDDEVTWRGGMPPPPGTHIYTERQVREMLAQKG